MDIKAIEDGNDFKNINNTSSIKEDLIDNENKPHQMEKKESIEEMEENLEEIKKDLSNDQHIINNQPKIEDMDGKDPNKQDDKSSNKEILDKVETIGKEKEQIQPDEIPIKEEIEIIKEKSNREEEDKKKSSSASDSEKKKNKDKMDDFQFEMILENNHENKQENIKEEIIENLLHIGDDNNENIPNKGDISNNNNDIKDVNKNDENIINKNSDIQKEKGLMEKLFEDGDIPSINTHDKWNLTEITLFNKALIKYGRPNFKNLSRMIGTKTEKQIENYWYWRGGDTYYYFNRFLQEHEFKKMLNILNVYELTLDHNEMECIKLGRLINYQLTDDNLMIAVMSKMNDPPPNNNQQQQINVKQKINILNNETNINFNHQNDKTANNSGNIKISMKSSDPILTEITFDDHQPDTEVKRKRGRPKKLENSNKRINKETRVYTPSQNSNSSSNYVSNGVNHNQTVKQPLHTHTQVDPYNQNIKREVVNRGVPIKQPYLPPNNPSVSHSNQIPNPSQLVPHQHPTKTTQIPPNPQKQPPNISNHPPQKQPPNMPNLPINTQNPSNPQKQPPNISNHLPHPQKQPSNLPGHPPSTQTNHPPHNPHNPNNSSQKQPPNLSNVPVVNSGPQMTKMPNKSAKYLPPSLQKSPVSKNMNLNKVPPTSPQKPLVNKSPYHSNNSPYHPNSQSPSHPSSPSQNKQIKLEKESGVKRSNDHMDRPLDSNVRIKKENVDVIVTEENNLSNKKIKTENNQTIKIETQKKPMIIEKEEIVNVEIPKKIKELRITKDGNLLISDKQQKEGIKSCSASLTFALCSNNTLFNSSPFNMQTFPNTIFIKDPVSHFKKEVSSEKKENGVNGNVKNNVKKIKNENKTIVEKSDKNRTIVENKTIENKISHNEKSKISPKLQKNNNSTHKKQFEKKKNLYNHFLENKYVDISLINHNFSFLSYLNTQKNNQIYNKYVENKNVCLEMSKTPLILPSQSVCEYFFTSNYIFVLDTQNNLSKFKANEEFSVVSLEEEKQFNIFSNFSTIKFSSFCQLAVGIEEHKMKLFSFNKHFDFVYSLPLEKHCDQLYLSPSNPAIIATIDKSSNTIDFLQVLPMLQKNLSNEEKQNAGKNQLKFHFSYKLPLSFIKYQSSSSGLSEIDKNFKCSWSNGGDLFSIHNKRNICILHTNNSTTPKNYTIDKDIIQFTFLSTQRISQKKYFFVLTFDEILIFVFDSSSSSSFASMSFPPDSQISFLLSDPLERKVFYAYDPIKKNLFVYYIEERRDKLVFHLYSKTTILSDKFKNFSNEDNFVEMKIHPQSKFLLFIHSSFSFLVSLFPHYLLSSI
eukprot:TRINITY_DN6905_c0_g1_i1.p1 TRINITY_DN6905_c0_g1~~TRINITY_DN6905_c0_g1_i1.p1  ORF type:complete len:1319 (-),score=436.63 TRINITY_DN6905_c0_g1_i1:30-3986(-)